jgi:hypothetical protein
MSVATKPLPVEVLRARSHNVQVTVEIMVFDTDISVGPGPMPTMLEIKRRAENELKAAVEIANRGWIHVVRSEIVHTRQES